MEQTRTGEATREWQQDAINTLRAEGIKRVKNYKFVVMK